MSSVDDLIWSWRNKDKIQEELSPKSYNLLYILHLVKITNNLQNNIEKARENMESFQNQYENALREKKELDNKWYASFLSSTQVYVLLVLGVFNIIYGHIIRYPHKGFGFYFFNLAYGCSCGLYPIICNILLINFHIKKLKKKKDKKKKKQKLYR